MPFHFPKAISFYLFIPGLMMFIFLQANLGMHAGEEYGDFPGIATFRLEMVSHKCNNYESHCLRLANAELLRCKNHK